MKSTAKLIKSKIWRKTKDQVDALVEYSVWDKMLNKAADQAWKQIKNRVRNPIESQLWDELWNFRITKKISQRQINGISGTFNTE